MNPTCVAVLAQNDPSTLLCALSQNLELRGWNEKVLLHLALALTEAINKEAAVSTLLCRTQVPHWALLLQKTAC